MPEFQYDKPIDFRIERDAVLFWEIGKQSSSTISRANNSSILGSVIESVDRQNNPSKYTLRYGKAEQAIFMTSFKNLLSRQAVFKNIDLITDPTKIKTKDVIITIYFKSTRVSSPELGYQISLSVDMSVKSSGKPTFMRNYFVKSDDRSFGSFQEQQVKISNKLAEKLIDGLRQWHEANK